MCSNITSINDIALVTRLVLHKMGEQGLEQKVSATRVLSDEDYVKLFPRSKKSDNTGVYTGGTIVEFASDDRKIVIYAILVRQAPFKEFFPAYMHELGHLANMDKIHELKGFSIPDFHVHVYSEALAFAFENYAKEKYNEIEKEYFKEVSDPDTIRRCLGFLSTYEYLDTVHRKAYEVLSEVFASSPKYPEGLFKSYKEAYEALKDVPPILPKNGTLFN